MKLFSDYENRCRIQPVLVDSRQTQPTLSIHESLPDGAPGMTTGQKDDKHLPSTIRSMPASLIVLNREIIACTLCPRLEAYREQIGREKRRAYLGHEYWARPVPGFGDPNARVLVLGLAPGAHGSNRTGRPFTGDASGKFLFPILHQVGFASQPTAEHRDDGLKLTDCYITAAVRCAPPDNKPLPSELLNCSTYLDRELAILPNIKVVIALGKIAFDAYLAHLKRKKLLETKSGLVFGHARRYKMANGVTLLASYHPSNQNTATGKLTAAMFEAVFREASDIAARSRTP
jgi:uracil-DNA glycosylase family 4